MIFNSTARINPFEPHASEDRDRYLHEAQQEEQARAAGGGLRVETQDEDNAPVEGLRFPPLTHEELVNIVHKMKIGDAEGTLKGL